MSEPSQPTTLPVHRYLFAGDFNVQSMRYEEESPFPVQRHGFSFDVHRNKCVSGCFILRHLIELCFEYSHLPANEGTDNRQEAHAVNLQRQKTPAEAATEVPDRTELQLELDAAKRKRQTNLLTRVMHTPAEEDPDLLTHYHESVAILRRGGLRDESTSPTAENLRAPRIHDTHSISASCSAEAPVNLKAEAFGNFTQPLQDSWSGDIVLNLDMKKFGMEKGPGGENKDFANLPTSDSASNLITRLVVPRAAMNDPKKKSHVEAFISGHRSFLKGYLDARGEPDPGKGCSALVISSESLRNTGLDISYRVTWERSVSGIIRCLRTEITPLEDFQECWDLGRKIRHLILQYDYLVICFYNDGALILPTRPDVGKDGEAVLIADPSQIEGDHSNRFEGSMRGTETLVTASIAFHLCQSTGTKDPEEPKLFHPKSDELDRIRKGTIHGVKASRYLQSHGYVTLHHCAYRVLRDASGMQIKSDDKRNPDGKEKAYAEMSNKLASSNADIVRYLWNRTRSTAYALEGLIAGAETVLSHAKTKETKFCTWPLGDLAEILASGHPTYGSFPPVGLKLDEGREAIEKETRRVNDAWNDSGWLEVGRFQWADVIKTGAVSRGGYPYWSLREVAVKRLAAALLAAKDSAGRPDDESRARSVALALLCEMMIRFGTRNMNRKGMDVKKQFDYELVKRVFQFSYGELKTPDFYDDYFLSKTGGNQEAKQPFSNFNPVIFLKSLADSEETNDFTHSKNKGANELLDVAFGSGSHLAEPTSGSLLGLFPEFTVRKFHTFDGRDTQSFRDIRERLLNFQASDEKKPLNLLVLGSPGSGKSFGVTNVIEGVFGTKKVAFLEYNVASFSGNKSALTSAFLEIQNVGHQGKMPVVFWDEFDTTVDGTKLAWLASFLGPMQDGKFLIDQTSRYLPKCVFVFAGSVFSRFEQIRFLNWLQESGKPGSGLFRTTGGSQYDPSSSGTGTVKVHDFGNGDGSHSESHDFRFKLTQSGTSAVREIPVSLPASKVDWAMAKGRDFKSRITGVLDIASVDPRTDEEMVFGLEEDKDAWLFRRAAAVRQSFEKHADLLNSDKELQISESTLFSFLTVQAFEHGYRSIENMVRMSSLNQRAIADGSVVPTEAQVRIHCRTDLFSTAVKVNDADFQGLF